MPNTDSSMAHDDAAADRPTILVLGGTGGVGEGVVGHLLSAGANVIASSRSADRAAEFARRIDSPHLETVALDALADSFDADVAALVDAHGRFDAVVVSVASWGEQGRKPLLALDDDEWAALVDENQTAVFRAFRALYPAVQRNGIIVQLNGMSADIPFPGAGGVALTAAATKSMVRTIAEEMRGRGPRVYEVILGVIRTRARRLAGIDDARWIDGEQIGAHIAALLTGDSDLADTVVHYFVDKAAGAQAVPPRM